MLVVVRHGRTEANASGLLQGRMDLPLDEVGRDQAAAVAAALGATVDRVIASPLLRARQTAQAIAERAGLEEGDILLTVSGQDASSFDGLGDILEPFAGEEVALTYQRDGEMFETTTVVGEKLTDRGAASIDGLLTGWHEPMASHLLMLEAVTTLEALQVAYGEAIESRYRWHEFGDVHLITR